MDGLRITFEFCTHNIILLEVKVNICLSTGQEEVTFKTPLETVFKGEKI